MSFKSVSMYLRKINNNVMYYSILRTVCYDAGKAFSGLNCVWHRINVEHGMSLLLRFLFCVDLNCRITTLKN